MVSKAASGHELRYLYMKVVQDVGTTLLSQGILSGLCHFSELIISGLDTNDFVLSYF